MCVCVGWWGDWEGGGQDQYPIFLIVLFCFVLFFFSFSFCFVFHAGTQSLALGPVRLGYFNFSHF